MPRPSYHIFTRDLLLLVCITGAPLAAQPTGVTFSVTPGTVYSGAQPRAVITYSVPAVSRSVVRVISSNPGLAYASPDSIVMPQGATSASTNIIVAPTCTDATVRFDAGPRADNLLVLAPTIASFTLITDTVPGGRSTSGYVALNGVSCAPLGIQINSSNSVAVAATPATIATGARTGTFQVATNQVAAPTLVVLTMSALGTTRAESLLVWPPVLQSISVAPTTIRAGQPAAGTIVLNRRASPGGALVQLTTPCSATILRVSGSVTVGPGAFVAPFPVTLLSPPVTQMTCPITATYDGTQRRTTVTLSP